MPDIICDFCSAPEVQWRYHARNIRLGSLFGVEHMSEGDWAACSPCRELIDAGDREGLLKRSIERWEVLYADNVIPMALVAATVAQTHRAFWSAKYDQPPTPLI